MSERSTATVPRMAAHAGFEREVPPGGAEVREVAIRSVDSPMFFRGGSKKSEGFLFPSAKESQGIDSHAQPFFFASRKGASARAFSHP